MYIDAKTLIELAALLTALGVIGGAALWAVKFVDRQKKQDQELTAIRKEQTLICYGVMAYDLLIALPVHGLTEHCLFHLPSPFEFSTASCTFWDWVPK